MRQPARRREPVAETPDGNLRADMRLHAARLAPLYETAPHRTRPFRSASAIAGISSSTARSISVLGQRRSGKKAEGAGRVQFNVFACHFVCHSERDRSLTEPKDLRLSLQAWRFCCAAKHFMIMAERSEPKSLRLFSSDWMGCLFFSSQ